MPWVKLDDQFPGHPKVVAAGGDAAWLYVCGLCYCQAHLTDGVISAAILPRLSDRSQPVRLANKLVSVGLWDAIDGGYMVHDYAEHNTPADKVKAKRAATRARVEAYRERQRGNADGNAVSNADGNAVTGAYQDRDGNGHPLTANRNPQSATAVKDLAAAEAPPPVSKRKPKRDPDAAPELPLVCTRQQALDAIATASAGRFVASQPDKGGAFKLDRLRHDPDCIAKCSAIGRWLAGGGDAWRGNLDGRALGTNLDAWIAQSGAWDGNPVTGGRTRRPSELDVPDWSKEGAF